MSSLKDVPLQQALDAIASSLRGEQEPIRAFNVLIDDAALKAEWFRMTGEAVTGTLTQQQKVLASHSLILAGTTAAQGDLERSQGSLNTTIKTLGVSVDDLKTQFGVGLLGAVQGTDLAMGGEGLTTTIQDLKEPVKELGGMVGDFAVNVGEVATMGKDAADSLNSFADSMGPVGDAAQEVAGILSGGMLNVILKINDAAVNAASALRALVGVQDSVAARASGPGNLGPWANRVLQ
jgi:methyl-accepting chemotaxis protein